MAHLITLSKCVIQARAILVDFSVFPLAIKVQNQQRLKAFPHDFLLLLERMTNQNTSDVEKRLEVRAFNRLNTIQRFLARYYPLSSIVF